MTTTDSGTRDDTVLSEDSAPGAYALQTPEEIAVVREVLAEAGLFSESMRMGYLGLLDPVRGTPADAPVDRRFRVFLLNTEHGRSHDVVVSATHRRVESDTVLDTEASGELPVLEEEFEVVESVLAALSDDLDAPSAVAAVEAWVDATLGTSGLADASDADASRVVHQVLDAALGLSL